MALFLPQMGSGFRSTTAGAVGSSTVKSADLRVLGAGIMTVLRMLIFTRTVHGHKIPASGSWQEAPFPRQPACLFGKMKGVFCGRQITGAPLLLLPPSSPPVTTSMNSRHMPAPLPVYLLV